MLSKKIEQAINESSKDTNEVSIEIGVAYSTIRNWILGNRQPSFDLLKKISEVTGKPISWFFDEPSTAPLSYDRQLQEKLLNLIESNSEELNKKFDILLNKITLSGLTKEIGEKNNVIQFPNTRNNSHSRKLTSNYTIPYFEEQKVGAGEVFASGMHYEEQAAGMISVESYGRPDVALRVLGESMEPDIPNGSIVLVRLTALQSPLGWKSGDILLLYRSDTETLLVRQVVVGSSSRIKLVSPNMEAEYITMSDVIIRGVVEDIIKPNQAKEILERIEPIEG